MIFFILTAKQRGESHYTIGLGLREVLKVDITCYFCATKSFCRPKLVKKLRFDSRGKLGSGKVQEKDPKKESLPILKPETRKIL